MKGSLRRIHDHLKNKTNFNDWCDPKFNYLHRRGPEPTLQEKCTEVSCSQSPKESELSITSKEIEDIRTDVKAGFPLLTLEEVRDFRLPFHENLLLKLHDRGFIGTSQFIKDIIDLDDEWHKITEEDFLVRKRPQLKFNEPALRLLSSGLSLAEIANRNGKKTDELSSILDLAVSFTNMDDGLWCWLSEELYEQCVHITDSVENPNEHEKELAAIIKYLFAEFLLDVLHESERAKHHVEESMKLSEGKLYNAVVLTGQIKDFLYLDSCILLHKILLVMAQENRDSNIENSIELIKQSLHWTKVVKDKVAESETLMNLIEIYVTDKKIDEIPDYLENYLKLCTEQSIGFREAEALLNLIEIYIKTKEIDKIPSHLENCLKLCKEQSNISGLCEGHILSAKYHNLTEEHDLEGEDLQTLLKTAKDNNLLEMVALAHQKLAIFYFLRGNKPDDAQSHAIEAYHCHINLNKKCEVETSSCLIGICQGHRILAEYIDLLSEADKAYGENFDTLMKWDTLRIPFFNNVKLLQLESHQNAYLQNRMDNLKYDELNYKDEDHSFKSRRTFFSTISIFSKANYRNVN